MTPAEPDNDNNPGQNFPGTPNQIRDGNWNPYESTWINTGPVIVQAQTVSALAILSMISGIVSIPLICLCFVAIPFSLFSIVAGHISRGICRRSQGRVTGDGMAVAGLSLGYVSLAIIIGMFAFMFAVGVERARRWSGCAKARNCSSADKRIRRRRSTGCSDRIALLVNFDWKSL
jgi:hypothetical protein